MSRLPPLYALRAFESASRQLSFTRAAQELNITQSAVSRHIKTLEQDLGCLLFERRGPSLKLTPTGLILAKDLTSAFADIAGRLRSGAQWTGLSEAQGAVHPDDALADVCHRGVPGGDGRKSGPTDQRLDGRRLRRLPPGTL